MKKLIVRWGEEFCNLPVTHITRDGGIVEAYRGSEFVGFFDLGCVNVLYVSDMNEDKGER